MSDRLTQSGIAVSEEQKAALRNTIADQIDSVVEPQEPNAPVSAQPQLQPAVKFVYDQIDATFESAGTHVTSNDPEFKIIQVALDDPKGSLAKTIIAANLASVTKKERVTSQQEGAAARVGGGASQITGTAPDDATGLDLLKVAYTK